MLYRYTYKPSSYHHIVKLIWRLSRTDLSVGDRSDFLHVCHGGCSGAGRDGRTSLKCLARIPARLLRAMLAFVRTVTSLAIKRLRDLYRGEVRCGLPSTPFCPLPNSLSHVCTSKCAIQPVYARAGPLGDIMTCSSPPAPHAPPRSCVTRRRAV